MDQAPSAFHHLRGLTPLSLCDWPGKNAAVAFLGGCNLRCPTCHNADLAWRMESLPEFPAWKLKVFLAERKPWLDGVVVTGGEPTTAPGLPEILYEIRKIGLPVKLDTNGMRPDVVEGVLDEGLAQAVAVDLKGPFGLYPALTGGAAGEDEARTNFSRLFALADARPGVFRFRLTRVPLLDEADIFAVRRLLPDGFKLTVQEFVAPRRKHAHPDHEARRPARDLVH